MKRQDVKSKHPQISRSKIQILKFHCVNPIHSHNFGVQFAIYSRKYLNISRYLTINVHLKHIITIHFCAHIYIYIYGKCIYTFKVWEMLNDNMFYHVKILNLRNLVALQPILKPFFSIFLYFILERFGQCNKYSHIVYIYIYIYLYIFTHTQTHKLQTKNQHVHKLWTMGGVRHEEIIEPPLKKPEKFKHFLSWLAGKLR